jgi:hypothetical protein
MSETDDPPPVMVAAPTAPLLREGMLSNAVSFLSHSQVRHYKPRLPQPTLL